MVKVTVQRLRNAKAYVEQCKNHKSPFGYACLKSSIKIDKALEKISDEYDAKLHELAILNEDKSYKLNDKNQMTFTKIHQDALNKLWKEQGKEEVEYEPYFATSVGAVKGDLVLLDALNGIVVDVNIESMYLAPEAGETEKK